MEHPQIDINQIKKTMTIDEIQSKIRELTEKLNFAYRMQKQPLINQLHMALESYIHAQKDMLNEMFSGDGEKYSGKIDIK